MAITGEQLAKELSTLLHNSSGVYTVSGSDNPSQSLTSAKFNGANFINWSRQIRLALGTKEKLGFVDGSVKKPEASDKDYTKWLRCDRLVACWILSSMESEIADSFVYTTSAMDLWNEIAERFSQSSASMLYQAKMESMAIVQGSMSVTSYYNKLKKCWDEIQCLNGIPDCICGHMAECTCKILKRVRELEAQDRLLHFLINLSPEYDVAKNQILSTVPVPSLNSAYQTVLQVEKQKQISASAGNVVEPVAFMAGSQGQATGSSTGQNFSNGNLSRRDERRAANEKKYCNLCNMKGHTSDKCFEVIGYPDWYKGKKGKKTGQMAATALKEDTPIHEGDNSGRNSKLDPALVASMYQEVMRMVKDNTGHGFSGPSE